MTPAKKIRQKFYLMFALRCRQVDIVACVSSPLSSKPTIKLSPCSVVVTGDKLIAIAFESTKSKE